MPSMEEAKEKLFDAVTNKAKWNVSRHDPVFDIIIDTLRSAGFIHQSEIRYPEKKKCPIHDFKKPRPSIGGCDCNENKIYNQAITDCTALNGGGE